MKKILIIIAFLSVLTSNSQNWIEFTNSESVTPTVNVILSNDTIVNFNVSIVGIFETPIDTFNRINIREHTKMDSVGYPEIPIVSFLVAIPQCDSVNCQVSILDSTLFGGYNIYPAPELVLDTLPSGMVAYTEQFIYDSSAYSNNSYFPDRMFELTEKGVIRSQHFIRVNLYPVQFNPFRKEIKAYSELQISLTFNNPTGTLKQNAGIFNEVIGSTVINYESNS